MIMKSVISILCIITLFSPQDKGDSYYTPQALLRELESLCGGNDFRLEELKISEASLAEQTTGGMFHEVICQGKKIAAVWTGRANCCRSGGCSEEADTGTEVSYEYFDYYIIFDLTGKVRSVKIFNYQATRGEEVTAKSWLRQFAGYDGRKELRLGKEIDSISGATVSALAITNEVLEKTEILKRISKP